MSSNLKYNTTKEKALCWGISSKEISFLCKNKRIPGATKKNRIWLIPSNTPKPDNSQLIHKNNIHDKYKNLEKNFKLIYPENSNATYKSLLNYSDDLNKPYQRWYRYKEGFSLDLVKYLIKEYSCTSNGIILDPFMGSGSTLIAARELGYNGIGFEVNPFSYFLAKCKLHNYTKNQIKEFKELYEQIIAKANSIKNIHYELPDLSISHKVFAKNIEKYFMTIGSLIEEVSDEKKEIKNLLKLGWLSIIEPICNYRKAGNGLKRKKYKNSSIISKKDIQNILIKEYDNIYIDLMQNEFHNKTILYEKSCIDMLSTIKKNSINGIIYSPPYANCFDYTEIYKLELWFGKFVSEYSELKNLRNKSIHSHLNCNYDKNLEIENEFLNDLLNELKSKKLWDKKIPKMLQWYYQDMFDIINKAYNILVDNGFCCIVVGNSAYGGIIFPTDLILAEYAQKRGFIVDKIEIDRYIITSSQQYEITKKSRKYLRESIICLRKKNV